MKKVIILSDEEKKYLLENGFNSKQIEYINNFLYKHSDELTEFRDVVGDTMIPNKMFFLNSKLCGDALFNDPEISMKGCNSFFRRILLDSLIRRFGPYMLGSKQVFENRKQLIDPESSEIDDKVTIPGEPVIWVSNHHFKDDVLGSLLATSRHANIFFGSIPVFLNTLDGLLAYLNGSAIVNRKSKSSKNASLDKMSYVLNSGSDLLLYPEGVWNKSANKLMINLWHGVYKAAIANNAKVVPIVHYIMDPTGTINKKRNMIHTVVDDPIDASLYTEDEFIEMLRDKMATWYYLMMEKYCDMSREEFFDIYRNRAVQEGYIINPDDLTTDVVAEMYMKDLSKTTEKYDSTIECSCHYKRKDLINPEDVFGTIANLDLDPLNPNYSDVIAAKELVRIRKKENYQERF